MLYIPMFVLLLMVLLNLLFKFASILRLSVPLLYAFIVPVFLPRWIEENETLVTVIWFILIGLVITSWIITIRKKIRHRHTQIEVSSNAEHLPNDTI